MMDGFRDKERKRAVRQGEGEKGAQGQPRQIVVCSLFHFSAGGRFKQRSRQWHFLLMRNQDSVWTCWEAIRSDNWASWRRIYVFYIIAHLLCGIFLHTYIYSRCINTPQPNFWCADLPSPLPAGVRTRHGPRSVITSTANQYETTTCWREPLTIINKDALSHFVYIVFMLSRGAVLLLI